MKLYYEDAYIKEFKAFVTNVTKKNNGYEVELSQTAFYPEGGGQPFDTGALGDAYVTAVYERGGGIIHITDRPVEIGGEVICKIDWERRFRLMQDHTGEHILSGIINKHFGLTNIDFHMGREFVTIDLDGMLKPDQLEFAEKLANQGVYDNIPVLAEFKSGSDLDNLTYRSKIELRENVRIVSIDGYDVCACCGIHCGYTGEVGAIKIVTAQKYKAGMRIYMLCGMRAMEDYAAKNRSVYDISVTLSAKPDEVASAVKQLCKENESLCSKLAKAKTSLLKFIAEKVPYNSEPAIIFESGLNPDELRRLCVLICERVSIAAVFSTDAGVYKYAIGSKTHDIRQITSMLNSELNGRGGGKKELTQGTINGSEERIKELLNASFKQFS